MGRDKFIKLVWWKKVKSELRGLDIIFVFNTYNYLENNGWLLE